MSDFYDQFVNSLDDLSLADLQKLHSLISAKLPKNKTPTENKDLGGDTLNCCPKCGSTNYKKHGTKDGRQRYICKDCKKTFSESNATIFYHSRLSTGQWKELLRGMIDRLSTTEISKNVGISQPAVWYNMQKVFEVLAKVYGKQDTFIDIAEADETFTHTSFKGKRNAEYFIKYLRRMPRHQRSREEKIEYLMKYGLYDELAMYEPDYLEQLLSDDVLTYDRGISNRDQTNIVVCTDRNRNLFVSPVSVGKLTSDDATKALGGRFANDAILVTDENNAYNELAESEGIQLEQILSTKHVKGPFNLARINAICDNLKDFLGPDKYRPATKYLDLWLMFYIWLEKNKELNTYQKRDLLFDLISDNRHNMSMNYDKHTERELTLNTKGLYPTKV